MSGLKVCVVYTEIHSYKNIYLKMQNTDDNHTYIFASNCCQFLADTITYGPEVTLINRKKIVW